MIVSLAQAAADSGSGTGLSVAIAGGAGVATGAVLTVLAALYGQHREAKREHARWLRDQRLEAYIALEDAVLAMDSAARRATNLPFPKPDSVTLYHAFNLAKTRVMFLGPEPVRVAVDAMRKRIGDAWSGGETLPDDLIADFGESVEAVIGTRVNSSRWRRNAGQGDTVEFDSAEDDA